MAESRSKGGAVSRRVEARNRQPEGALLPDKMVLTPPNSSINATESVPWAMLELWAALSLYHEDTPQIVSAPTSLSHTHTHTHTNHHLSRDSMGILVHSVKRISYCR